MLYEIEVPITTDAAGDAVDYGGLRVTGKIVAIKYAYGTLAATTDLTVTGETSGAPVLTIANLAQADAWLFPRILPNKHTDGVAFTNAAAEPPRVFNERIKIVTAQGGNVASGTVTLYIENDVFQN